MRSTRKVARRRCAKLRVAGNINEITNATPAREAAQAKRERGEKRRTKKGRGAASSSAWGRFALNRASAMCGFASSVEDGASSKASCEATREAVAESLRKRT